MCSEDGAYTSPDIRTTLSQRFDRMPRLGELESFVDRCLGAGMHGPTVVQVNATSSARETFVALSATKSEERE